MVKILPIVGFISVLFMAQNTLANVPVVNLNGDSETTSSYGDNGNATPVNANLSTTERLTILERQISNLNQQNTTTKITDLQNQLQQMQGKIDELSHQNQVLADQMKQQYLDMSNRLTPTPDPVEAKVSVEPSPSKIKPKVKVDANASLNTAIDPVVDSAAESAAYQKAFNLLKKGDYVRAAPLFENFLKTYPNGSHAANAHFWLGEIHLSQNQSDAAASEYRRVISDFPNSDKVQMAELKLGFAYHDQNDLCKAKATFEKVIKAYPKTTAAGLAQKALIDIPSPCTARKASNKI